MNTLLTLLFTLLAIPSQYRMMVISDPHVLDQSLFNVNSASMQAKMANDINQSQYAQAAFNQLIDKALTDKPDVVLIPGDMTMNGSRVSHDAVAAQLHRLTDANIKVCLIPGENDINNSNAASYLGATPQSVPSISSAEFDSIYAFTKQAFPNRRDDPNSHSYVLTLAPRLTLIGADCTVGSYSDSAGVFTESTLNWILAQADSAVDKGDRVIAMMHYQLMEHTDGFAAVIPQGLIKKYETVAANFRAHGIELVLTGHMHIDNISTRYTNGRDSLVEISTGTPIMYPNPYRMITVSGARDQISCVTDYITSLTDNSNFTPTNNQAHFEYVLQNVVVSSVIEQYWPLTEKSDSLLETVNLPEIIEALGGMKLVKKKVKNLIKNLPQDAEGRRKYVVSYLGASGTEAAIIHLQGNENEKDTKDLKATIQQNLWDAAQDMISKANIVLGIITLRTTIKNTIYGDKVEDFLDGFFGDYTRYKKADQNRTDDLHPDLRFAQLPHRDYYATVTFDLMGYGEDSISNILINEPAKISRPKDPSADGMYFVNWYSDPELTQLYDFNTEIISDDDVAITLYAKFIPIITFTLGDVKKMYDGTPIAPLYKYKGSLPKSCKEQVEVDTIITNVDSVTYRVSKTTIWNGDNDVTANYKIEWSQDAASMVVTPRTIAITTGSASGTYNGVALTAQDTTMSGDGFVNGEGIDITYTGSQTYVGNSDNTITYIAQEGTNIDNYTINVTPGTLTIAPAALSIALRDTTKMYDGQPMTVTYDVVGTLINDDELLLTIDNESITDADAQKAVITNVQIINAAKEDHTAQYAIDITDSVATMEVTQRSIQITTASATKIYDGTPLTKDSLSMSGDGFVEGEGIDITFMGTQTFVGESDNTIDYTAKEGTLLANYDITIVPGQLEITKRAITIISASDSIEYDGLPLTAESVEYIGEFADGEGVTIFFSGEQIEPGTSENIFTYEANEGTDLRNYDITTIFGTLIVVESSDTPTTLVDPSSNELAEKLIFNNHFYIRKSGILYDATGQEYVNFQPK